VERSESNQTTSRRGFFGWLAGISVVAWLGSIIYPVVAYLKPPAVAEPDVASVEVVKLSEFPPGSSQIFKFGRRPGLLIHTKSGELKAFFATCTHLDCTVSTGTTGISSGAPVITVGTT
jgi:Rieske Fe-S protein